MSKKKPYSKVRAAKVMRMLERERNKIDKDLLKKGDAVPEWYRRLLNEWTENYKNLIKLNDFLYITEVEGGDTRFTDEALKLAVCDRKLLVKQEKVMLKFVDVLTERVNHGFCTDVNETCKTKCSCKDCGDKADAKATTDADAKDADKAATEKVAKKPAKKAVKKSAK